MTAEPSVVAWAEMKERQSAAPLAESWEPLWVAHLAVAMAVQKADLTAVSKAALSVVLWAGSKVVNWVTWSAAKRAGYLAGQTAERRVVLTVEKWADTKAAKSVASTAVGSADPSVVSWDTCLAERWALLLAGNWVGPWVVSRVDLTAVPKVVWSVENSVVVKVDR